MTELELLDYIIICGRCGVESDNLWCGICWEVMTCWEKSTPIPAYRCIYCEYPEPSYLVKDGGYCTGCGIRYGVKLIPIPKKKKPVEIIEFAPITMTMDLDASATTATADTIYGRMYYSTDSASTW